MKKIISIVIIIILITFLMIINHNKKSTATYKITDPVEATIVEKYTKNKNNKYEYKITIKNLVINLIKHQSTDKKETIMKINKQNYKDYNCYLITFKTDLKEEIICEQNKQQYSLTYFNETERLEINELFSQNKTPKQIILKSHPYKIITSSINKTIIFDTFDGVEIIKNNTTNHVKLFKKEKLSKKEIISTADFVIIPNYNDEYRIKEFQIINIKTHQINAIELKSEMTYNFFFNGVYNGKVYLFNIDEKIQYEINPKNKTIKEVGNEFKGIKILEDAKWKIYQVDQVIKEKTTWSPILQKIITEDYEYQVITNQNKNTELIRTIKTNVEYQTTILKETNIKILEIYNEEIYYQNENKIYLVKDGYHQIVVENNEFIYNNNINIMVS